MLVLCPAGNDLQKIHYSQKCSDPNKGLPVAAVRLYTRTSIPLRSPDFRLSLDQLCAIPMNYSKSLFGYPSDSMWVSLDQLCAIPKNYSKSSFGYPSDSMWVSLDQLCAIPKNYSKSSFGYPSDLRWVYICMCVTNIR